LLANVHLACQGLRRLVATELDEMDVSMSEALILRVIHINSRVTVRELVEVTGLVPSTLTTTLTRLEDRQYLYREQLEGDMRFTVVRLTPVGEQIADFVDEFLDTVEDALTAHLPAVHDGSIAILANALFDYSRRGMSRPFD
jgi:DNA-binding MarR family transcriptional regulator